MGPFSVLLSLSVLSDVFGAVDKTISSFSAHGKIGNFIIIIKTAFAKLQPSCQWFITVSRGRSETNSGRVFAVIVTK